MSVYSWGSNRSGQLGHSLADRAHGSPESLSAFDGEAVRCAAGGDGHSLISTEFGHVYAFGRGTEGALGGSRLATAPREPRLVVELPDEAGVSVACGAHTSAAVTAAGDLYTWGLVHVELGRNAQEGTAVEGEGGAEAVAPANAGALTGLAAGRRAFAQDTVLQRVVQQSTEMWLRAEEDLNEELEEMARQGYEAADTDREYQGMLAVVTARRPVAIPRRAGIAGFVVEASCGWGHVMARCSDGSVFGCGYNDRGQLGLGHRINTATFERLSFFSDNNLFALQIACGQQHTLCRVLPAREREQAPQGGADLYVWGNGVLGQLGLGRRGVTKGRLTPCLHPQLQTRGSLGGVRHAAAGANHSLCVSRDGALFFFGHNEYGQGGSTRAAGRTDFDVDSQYRTFTPQRVQMPPHLRVARVSCGATFSLALSEDGEVYSFGWNEGGCLGRGTGHVSLAPLRVPSVGPPHTPPVVDIACGHIHAFCVAGSSDVLAPVLSRILTHSAPQDLRRRHREDVAIRAPNSPQLFLCHSFVLQARAPALAAQLGAAAEPFARLKAASDASAAAGPAALRGGAAAASRPSKASRAVMQLVREMDEKLLEQQRRRDAEQREFLGRGSSGSGGAEDAEERDGAEEEDLEALLSLVEVDAEDASPVTLRALLNYLYTDRLRCPAHKLHSLARLAAALQLPRLHALCARKARRAAPAEAAAEEASTFVEDLGACVEERGTADVAFVVEDAAARDAAEQQLAADLEEGAAAADGCAAMLERLRGGAPVLYAHRAVLELIPYFRALLSGNYVEGAAEDDVVRVDVSGFVEDGISMSALRRVMRFLYTGQRREVPSDDPQLAMGIAVAAGRIQLPLLLNHCERCLSLHIDDDPSNASTLLDFAKQFNLSRLRGRCALAMERMKPAGESKSFA